jgi:two-component system chemotaxis response regulator CheY
MDMANMHVLVVDDFPSMRKLVIKGLRQMGVVSLLEAGDGIDAVKLLESDRVDLLISDWNMPDMGGLELLRWVRQHFTQARLPFLMITTKGQQMDVVEAVRAGVDAYIVKPFTQEILEGKVARLAPQAAEFAAARLAALAAQAQAEAERAEAARAEATRQAVAVVELPETPEGSLEARDNAAESPGESVSDPGESGAAGSEPQTPTGRSDKAAGPLP